METFASLAFRKQTTTSLGFYFDFSATYVGVGMICPHIINVSLLIGGILSWGIMWPLIATKKGDWYGTELKSDSFQGLQGYKVFIAIAMILGDGLYNFFKVLTQTLTGLLTKFQARNGNNSLTVTNKPPPLKWYHIIVIYISAPTLAFFNAFGCGLTDWSLASTYGKLAIFTIGAWAGASHGVVLAGLAACGVMMNIVSTASDLMQDFKTGYLTLASPRSMFKAFPDLGLPDSQYPAPFTLVYHNMAKLGVNGFSALPKNCLMLCLVFFGAAIVVNLIRDSLGKNRAWFIPLPMAMSIPFYLGPYFAIDMCVGSLILYIWGRIDKAKADVFGPAVAAGLICGDGIWTLPSSILALAGVKPPICMKFLSSTNNSRVDKFLGS
ncbi:unnamed protein product [Ilex paraguariensis]|uniref:Uncharacterized protein n=1 Tax=Ilex paraguariensis TaxID=185542 RepID=A0ABC8UX95_9AQUA